MRADQREAILVILDLLDGNLPPKNAVTLFAIWTELAPMDICVAVGTVLADVRKHRFYVALCASNFLVHSAQRISGLVVIEFRDGADGLPAGVGVTVFAGDRQRSVRTACVLPLSSRCGNSCWRQGNK